MALRKAARQKAKIRLGLSAASGAGKTYSSILIAKGLAGGDLSNVAIIDTENGSADLYAELGDYNVLTLRPPFTPEKFISAIKECEKAGMEVIIIDSITHEWEGEGGCLDIYNSLGGKYQDWAKITPRHQKFIDAIVQSPVHMITTVRRKQDYDMVKDGSGKVKVEKVGMKEVTRDGYEYELTINLDIDMNHMATASKDRTGLFMGRHSFMPSEQTGELIKEWCESGAEPLPSAEELAKRLTIKEAKAQAEEIKAAIKDLLDCESIADLKSLKDQLPAYVKKNESFIEAATQRFNELSRPKVEVHTPTATNGAQVGDLDYN